MRNLLRWLLVVSSGLCVLVVVVLTSARDVRITTYQPIAPEFLPGHLLPQEVVCEAASYYSGDYFHLYCHSLNGYGEGTLFVTFDLKDKVIVHTTLLDPNKTIGDLIVAWGVPTGYQKVVLGNYVYWQGRYAYVATRVFGPQSNVGFIVYDNTVKNEQPWPGFINRRN